MCKKEGLCVLVAVSLVVKVQQSPVNFFFFWLVWGEEDVGSVGVYSAVLASWLLTYCCMYIQDEEEGEDFNPEEGDEEEEEEDEEEEETEEPDRRGEKRKREDDEDDDDDDWHKLP